jgi:hypothetical protein
VNVGVALATVTVIEVVPPEIYEVVSDGVKVAVIIELPYPATVAVLPLTETTEGVPEEYVQVPGVLEVGAVNPKDGSPYVLLTPLQVNVGVALETTAVLELVAELVPCEFVTVATTEIWAPTSAATSG